MLAKLASSQLSDGECYTRRTYFVFSQPVPLSDLQALMTAIQSLEIHSLLTRNKQVQFNHSYLFIYSFIRLFQHSVLYLRQTQLEKALV